MAIGAKWHRPNDDLGLRIGIREQGTTIALELAGEWDLATAPEVRRAIAATLDRGPECVLLDLTGLTFIDASGLHTAVELARRAERNHVRLTILIGSDKIRRTFEIAGLDQRIPLIQSRDTQSLDPKVVTMTRSTSGRRSKTMRPLPVETYRRA